jgi:hypothetical protein
MAVYACDAGMTCHCPCHLLRKPFAARLMVLKRSSGSNDNVTLRAILVEKPLGFMAGQCPSVLGKDVLWTIMR